MASVWRATMENMNTKYIGGENLKIMTYAFTLELRKKLTKFK